MTSSKISPRHTAFQSLPVIDIAGLSSTDKDMRQSAGKAIGAAARDVGFFYITNHGVPTELIEKLQARTREYFSQSLVRKMRHYIGKSSNHSGYVPKGEEGFYASAANTVDNKEAYDINLDMRDPRFFRPMLGPTLWPDLPGFQSDVQAYYQSIFQLSLRLFRGFALALDLPEDRFTRHIRRPPNQLRLIHYPFDPTVPPDTPGIGAHTDYECFTILLPTAPGLEVLNGAGEWIDVPLIENAFVINIGDMMEVLTNGTFVATSHRVRKVSEERYSFPMFCNLDYDTRIAPLPELVPAGQTPNYEPLVCGDHLYAQTVQTFSYLKKRLARGEISLPDGARNVGSYGRKEADSQ